MTDTPNDLAAVEQLLAERDAIHGWLTRLDATGAAASDPVRARVRRDYQVRMESLTERLRVHADAVASKLQEDRAEHAELIGRVTAAREALAEAELRHLVGEYDEGRYHAERTRHGSDLETFEVSLSAAAERIQRLEEVHQVVGIGPKVAAGDGVVFLQSVDAAEPPEVTEAPMARSEADPEFAIAIDELAPEEHDRLLAVFEEIDPLPPLTAAASGFAPLSFRPSGHAPVEPARPVAPPLRQNTPPLGMPAETPPRFVRPGDVVAAPPAAQTAADSIFEQDIVAGPRAEPSVPIVGRTLRCGECGAMNRPLEWYCEKCGAELTAL